MRTRVGFEVNPMEFDVIKEAIYNYRGKLIHQKNNYDLSYEDCKKIEKHLQIVSSMINEFNHEENVR